MPIIFHYIHTIKTLHKFMKNTPPENLHVSAPSKNDQTLPPEPTGPKNVRPSESVAERLVPRPIRDRKFRAHSFLAKLTPIQQSMLISWLKALSTREIVEKVAALPPTGFGLKVCSTTITRLRVLVRNVPAMTLANETLDTAADLLESHQTAAIPALHEALHVMLYSAALNHATRGAEPKVIDQTLAALIRLEKLRILTTASAQNLSPSAPATRHNIHVTISPAPPEQARTTRPTEARECGPDSHLRPEGDPAKTAGTFELKVKRTLGCS
jgi:hypothetical protein